MPDNGEQAKLLLLQKALSPERVAYLPADTKEAALRALVELLATSPAIADKDELREAVFEREKLMSTGIGLGLAVPHVRLGSVTELVMAVGISERGIADYESLDDRPVRLVFLIAAPAGQHAAYLRLLSAISSRAKTLNGRLLACRVAHEFYDTLTGSHAEADDPPGVQDT